MPPTASWPSPTRSGNQRPGGMASGVSTSGSRSPTPAARRSVGYLFAPLNAAPRLAPRVLLMACNIAEAPQLGGMWWAAETGAEHGDMVLFVDIATTDAAIPRIVGTEPYNDAVRGNDAADYLLSTPAAPNPNDPTGTQYNPMGVLVNRTGAC